MKQKIMLQAQKEIFKTGFRFTMADIARECGISTKTIYEWYASKEELILEMVQQATTEIKEREQSIIRDPKLGTMDKLKALLVLLPEDFHYFDVKRLYELQRYHTKVWSVLNSFIEEQWDGVARIVAEGQAEGLLEKFNTAVFIQMYIGGLHRLMEQAQAKPAGLTLSEALHEMVDILLDGIRKR
ncbi:TetR/AcrR family transcriptional regulator [Paenibacillus caui]|uniref:TetR/AcrR family transcriptional regulator n=1 Tax=Paenibacillus caui TaxID=2873927 RepID=UPI001CA94014|nr:TetR/AcrR family transcriptional regulator [Paenibacillus caui]